MRLSPFRLGSAALIATAVGVASSPARAQERPIVSSEVAVASNEATLLLEFADGGSLRVTFEGGEILLDGVPVGEYEPGQDLDSSWRGLLGQVISLRDEALTEALVAWSPPDGLAADMAEAGSIVDLALESAVTPQAAEAAVADAPRAEAAEGGSVSLSGLMALLEARESILNQVLEGLDGGDLKVLIGEDVVVEAGESIDGGLVVVGGNLDVYGVVRGDAIVVAGSVHLFDGGRVEGDLHLAEARFFRDGGSVEGLVRNIEPRSAEVPEVMDREELRREIRDAVAPRNRSARSFWSPFSNIGEGIAGLFQNLITMGLLALAGLGMLYFLPDRLEVISETIQQAPARSAAVGVASGFLLLPVYLLGMLVLAVSIVGIPVLLAWVPLFPIAAGLALAVGYAAVAQNLGRWISERDIQGLDWIRNNSAFSVLIGGLGALLLPFVSANIIHMAGDWIGFIEGLLIVFGVMASVAALIVGLGAVVLTRGGRRSGFADGVDFDFDLPNWTPRRPWREAWESAQGWRREAGTDASDAPEPSHPSEDSGNGGEGQGEGVQNGDGSNDV